MRKPENHAPSSFFLDQIPIVDRAARLGPILDLASGRGRHARACAVRGLRTIALDRNPAFLAEIRNIAKTESLPLDCLRGDLESGPNLPLAPGRFGAVLVFRYLWRPLCAEIAALLRPGGYLLYETFTLRQRDWNTGPRNPDFLLAPGELPTLFPGLQVTLSDETSGTETEPTALARLVAQRPDC